MFRNGVFNDENKGAAWHLVPLLIAFPIVLCQNYIIRSLSKIFKYCKCLKSISNIERFMKSDGKGQVDEKLGSYWNCLSGIDQKRIYTQEIYSRLHLGL